MMGVAVAFALLIHALPASAADSCTPPGTTYGTDTLSINVPLTSTYTVWVRMLTPSSSTNTILLNIDNTNCYNVGGAAAVANTWNWINYSDGDVNSHIQLNLSAGSHSFLFTGTASGVEVDRIELLADPTCQPQGVGDNCIIQSSENFSGMPVYRMYNPTLHDHYYTASEVNRLYVKLYAGYVDDGQAFKVSTTQQTAMVPVYSMYNGQKNDHWLTLDGLNRYWAINFGGYKDDGIAFYAYAPNNTGNGTACSIGKPIYELWNSKYFDHFYTINEGDRVWLILYGGFVDDQSAQYHDATNGNVVFCVPSSLN